MESNPDLFRAALVSLGSLGVIIRLTMRASPQYNISHSTEIIPLSRFLSEFTAIWQSATYVRAWWWPYTRKVVVWRGNRTQAPRSPPSTSSQSYPTKWYSNLEIGRNIHESSLLALRCVPSLLPTFERTLFRKQFPMKDNVASETVVDNPHRALQLDCLFSQYVDEWAIPLDSGVEAITRLDRWITYHDTSETGIPTDIQKKIYVHAPLEIRVSLGRGDHAYLSPARDGTPVVWIGVIMYRPYYTPTAYRQYFSVYEYLMRSLGGKPHWAKQHRVSAKEGEQIFGDGMKRWLEVRARVDPEGRFVNGYVRRHLLGLTEGQKGIGVGTLDGESGRLYKRFRAVL
jgi:D-arabinono-1,4-lactone oxidase